MSKVGGVIPFKAKPGQGGEVARLISSALPHVEREPGTLTWLVLRSDADPDLVFLVDLFADDESRTVHMHGEAAKQIFATVPPLLAEPPSVHPATVAAAKG
ncbi:putative quinol monooxygenase [Rhizobium sp. S152]|uniref:putative quinol monooxygenase n=1 Tax=Rhizobium sp. S152 TaxID=3055038 RepID=UPI0025A9EFF3|nr:putative quinol monooxygenase [Rhizobium sp. S152]MDM9627796.1 putative quinol monooxygenase [Rhizobium sp. S152]